MSKTHCLRDRRNLRLLLQWNLRPAQTSGAGAKLIYVRRGMSGVGNIGRSVACPAIWCAAAAGLPSVSAWSTAWTDSTTGSRPIAGQATLLQGICVQPWHAVYLWERPGWRSTLPADALYLPTSMSETIPHREQARS